MSLTGKHHIGTERTAEGTTSFRAVDPADGASLEPAYRDATKAEIDRALTHAAEATEKLKTMERERIASCLDGIAAEIMELGDPLLERAERETALPRARLVGERGRTMGQLQMFARVVRDGSHLDARVDHAIPDREPLPKPDVRRMLRPIGPVAVFGASNFPLAFSVAGGDTASALAAGCPVVVKGHPFHPGTSEFVGDAITRAIETAGLPAGTFSLVHGSDHAVGRALVQHSLTRAVGFTGSLGAGRALYDLASARPHPIPVFAEMGSVNPVFVLPGALESRGSDIAVGLAQSVLLGVGQFCTCPGVAAVPAGSAGDDFVDVVRTSLAGVDAGTMLHPTIRDGFVAGQSRLQTARRLPADPAPPAPHVGGALFETDAATFLAQHDLQEEVFGPATLIVRWSTPEQLEAITRALDGQLTATIHGTDDDLAAYHFLFDVLEDRAGRVIVNGFPTGVEVCPSMHHGGPYPATTDVRGTSVGTAAVLRFLRPVCYQDLPDRWLPRELQETNPTGVRRLVDGEWA